MVTTFIFLCGLSTCLLVSGTGQIVHVDLASRSDGMLQTCVLPYEVKVTITSEKETVHLNLEKNEHVDHEAPVFLIRHDKDGRAYTVQEPTLKVQSVGMYQDRDNQAVMKVSCKKRPRQNIQIYLEGRFVPSSGKLYHLAPVQSPLNTDFHPGNADAHVMREMKQSSHATDRTGLTASVALDKRTVDIDTTTFQIDILAYIDFLTVQSWMNISNQVAPALQRLDSFQRVKQAVALLLNDVNLRYKTISPRFNVHLIGCIIEDTKEGDWFQSVIQNEKDASTVNGHLLLDSFANWTETVHAFPKHDFIMIFTNHDMYRRREDGRYYHEDSISGVSQTASVCKESKGISIVKFNGDFMKNALVASHELGHGLGAKHDGDGNTCKGGDQYIMTPAMDTDPTGHQFQFSTCSIAYFRHYLQGVLRYGTPYSVLCFTSSLTTINVTPTVKLPGQLYSIDDQCRNIQGPRSYFCRGVDIGSADNVCRNMNCDDEDDPSLCSLYFPADGTPCGNKKWCYGGKCVSSALAPTKYGCRWGNNYWMIGTCDKDQCNSTVSGKMYYDICCETCAFMRPVATSLPTRSTTIAPSNHGATGDVVNTHVGTTSSTSHFQGGYLMCPDDWVAHGGSCYNFITSLKTWSEAMTSCQASGASLVNIETSTENEFLKKYLLRFSTCSSGWSSWAGGTDMLVEGQWRWSNTGKTISYTDWGDGQPDNDQASSNDCMLMCFSEKYRWGGEDCGTKQSYICEK
ncbi:A disintegrin and metalloproteinase with thrombospondin motifs adt-1-like isoform X2 [Haliotis rubra]|uniref:A disintegrin and metalloproteinase with thrombospondin motifs adt-1-like isoform X2 n=1 Tax=Haliotis rubra TaxID=36100 RepID=UPI001EE58F3B|nr:A disintegrin and metalloproteinase with thrombospondin motifs adt-1-like isoform X2 [Haliotis rubra]